MAQELLIYNGQPSAQAQITLGSWGAGTCEEAAYNTYSGSRSLRIASRGMYEGARMDFGNPPDLTSYFGNPNAYIQFVGEFWGTQDMSYDPLTYGLAPRPADIYGMPTRPGKTVRKVRVMMQLEGGRFLECQCDLAAYKIGDDGWMAVSLPLAAFKGSLSLPEYKLKRLVIAGDGTEPFHIGEIRVVTDTKAITAYVDDQNVAAYDYVPFRAICQGGAAPMEYSWDFDDKDGIQEDAVGEMVYHPYREPGEYVVTLTASDVFGVKKPATATAKVVVNP